MLHVEDEQVRLHLLEGNFGLEKESLRVTGDGAMAHTPDPFPDDPYIVKDFCENQTEINTGVHPSAAGAVRELRYHHERIVKALQERQEKEYLWPSSNPPYIRDEEDIPVAQFTGEKAGKTAYRNYLSDKYGRYKMTFSGIHVNYSFSDDLLRADYAAARKEEGGCTPSTASRHDKTMDRAMEEKEEESVFVTASKPKDRADEKDLAYDEDFLAHRSRLYLDLAQALVSYGWLLTAVTAASPVLDSSYFEKGGLAGFHSDGTSGTAPHRDVFTGMASVRSSEMGYWNAFAPIFDYTDEAAYAESIRSYVNRGFIQAASELYYPIRLKPPGENTLDNLASRGVNHIELRMFDLNPLDVCGLDERDVVFAQLLIIYLVCTPHRPLTISDQVQAVQNFKNAARYDLKTVKIVTPEGKSVPAADEGARVIEAMRTFFRSLPEGKPPHADCPPFPEESDAEDADAQIAETQAQEGRHCAAVSNLSDESGENTDADGELIDREAIAAGLVAPGITPHRIEEVLAFEYRKITRPEYRYAWQLRAGLRESHAADMLALARRRQDR